MGRLLDEYLANNVPALQNIVGGGQPQPEGATTFPLPPDPALQGQPIGPGGQPTGPMEQAAPAFPPPPGGQIDPAAVAGAGPTFGEPGGPAGPPEATFGTQQAQAQPDRSLEFDPNNPDSFAGMAAGTDPEQINKAVGVLEDQLKSQGTSIDEKHAEVTGSEAEESEDDPTGKQREKNQKAEAEGKKPKLTRQEKGLILMEFGLNLMASSGTGEGTFAGDVGKAGAAALGGHMSRKAAAAERLREAEERKQKSRLTEAQIAKAERADTTIKADADGNYIIVDEQTGESKPVLMDGEPVQESDRDKFASEVDRQAYEALECVDLKGAPLKACKRRALAYAKGGGAKVAFPELERGDQVDRVMRILEDPDKKSAKYTLPDGTVKRWRDMNADEQLEVADGLVDRRMELINRGNITTDGAGDTAEPTGDNFGLSQDQIGTMKPGKKYQITGGKWVAIVDGKVIEVD